MAKALADMLSDRSLWDERRRIARAFVERDRHWSSHISRYEPVYQKLLGRFAKAKAGCRVEKIMAIRIARKRKSPAGAIMQILTGGAVAHARKRDVAGKRRSVS